MNRDEIAEFIEEMEELGDKWTEEQVRDTYGNSSLEEAINDRKSSLQIFGNIIGTVLNGRK